MNYEDKNVSRPVSHAAAASQDPKPAPSSSPLSAIHDPAEKVCIEHVL